MSDVEAVVMAPGAGAANLLGASFLKRLASVEQRDGVLVLRHSALRRAATGYLSAPRSARQRRRHSRPRPPVLPKPQPQLRLNSYAYESQPMVKPTGFREYDARWLYPEEINLMGVQALGMGLGALLERTGGEEARSSSATTSAPIPARSNMR